jgi:hypothetical protein
VHHSVMSTDLCRVPDLPACPIRVLLAAASGSRGCFGRLGRKLAQAGVLVLHFSARGNGFWSGAGFAREPNEYSVTFAPVGAFAPALQVVRPAVNPLLFLFASQDGGRLVRAAACPGGAARFANISAQRAMKVLCGIFCAPGEPAGIAS